MTTPLTASFTAALDAVGLIPRVFASAAPLVAAQLDSAGPGTDVGPWLARALNYVALTAIVGLLLTAVAFVPDSVGLERAGRSATRMSAFAAGPLMLSDVALLVFGGSSASGRPLPQVVDLAILVAYAGPSSVPQCSPNACWPRLSPSLRWLLGHGRALPPRWQSP